MQSNIYRYQLTILVLLLTSILINPQETQFKKENNKQSLLEKYSYYLTEENEIIHLRTEYSQHFKINDSLYIAKIFSSPITELKNRISFYKAEADTNLTSPASGKVFKDGGNITKFDNTLRIQNTDAYRLRKWLSFLGQI